MTFSLLTEVAVDFKKNDPPTTPEEWDGLIYEVMDIFSPGDRC